MTILINVDKKHREAALEIAGFEPEDFQRIVKLLADCAINMSDGTPVEVRTDSAMNETADEYQNKE